MPDEFQNNSSRAGQEVPPEVEHQIEKIIDGSAKIKKPSGFNRFRRSFIAGDASSVGEHVLWNLAIPAAQDAVADALNTFVDMMIFGSKRNRYGSSPGGNPIVGHTKSSINYGGISSAGRAAISPAGQPVVEVQQRLDPTQITVSTRPEAEAVITKMIECLDIYKVVTVAELYRMLGHSPEYTDNKWGWTNLESADYKRVRDGVRLLLPAPEDLK